MVVLISYGIISCVIISQSRSWWNTYYSSDNLLISRIINQSYKPLLIDYFASSKDSHNQHDNYFYNLLSISHLLDPKIKIQLLPAMDTTKQIPKIAEGFSKVLMLNPSQEFLDKLEKEQNLKAKLVLRNKEFVNKNGISLWQLI